MFVRTPGGAGDRVWFVAVDRGRAEICSYVLQGWRRLHPWGCWPGDDSNVSVSMYRDMSFWGIKNGPELSVPLWHFIVGFVGVAMVSWRKKRQVFARMQGAGQNSFSAVGEVGRAESSSVVTAASLGKRRKRWLAVLFWFGIVMVGTSAVMEWRSQAGFRIVGSPLPYSLDEPLWAVAVWPGQLIFQRHVPVDPMLVGIQQSWYMFGDKQAFPVADAFVCVFNVGETWIAIPLWSILLPASALVWTTYILRHPIRRPCECAGCGYDLRGLGDRSTCPECGRGQSSRLESTPLETAPHIESPHPIAEADPS